MKRIDSAITIVSRNTHFAGPIFFDNQCGVAAAMASKSTEPYQLTETSFGSSAVAQPKLLLVLEEDRDPQQLPEEEPEAVCQGDGTRHIRSHRYAKTRHQIEYGRRCRTCRISVASHSTSIGESNVKSGEKCDC